MIRCLLILALASSQLLLMGHGGVYVCMGGDGVFCLETDPETCTCCKEGRHEDADHDSTACSCSCTNKEASSRTVKSVPATSCDTFVTNEDACGCLHLMIANLQSAPVTRTVHSFDLEWNRSLTAISLPVDYCPVCNLCLPCLSDTGFALCKPSLDARSLVMRC